MQEQSFSSMSRTDINAKRSGKPSTRSYDNVDHIPSRTNLDFKAAQYAVYVDKTTDEIITDPTMMYENLIYPITYKGESFAVQKIGNDIKIYELNGA